MYDKKGQRLTLETVIIFVLLAFALIAIWIFFFSSFGKAADFADRFLGLADIDALPEISEKNLRNVLNDPDKFEEYESKVNNEIIELLGKNRCDVAANYFKSSMKNLDKINDNLNAQILADDLKKYYLQIIQCYSKGQIDSSDCNKAYDFYLSVKDDVKLDDKNLLGDGLFDIALCYKNAGDKIKSEEKFNEFLKDYGSTNNWDKSDVDLQLRQVTGELTETCKIRETELMVLEEKSGKTFNIWYSEANAPFRDKNYPQSQVWFNQFVDIFQSYNCIPEVKQRVANAYYFLAKSELQINSNCVAFESRYQDYINRGYTRERFLRQQNLIEPQFIFDVGECYNDDLRSSAYFQILSIKYPAFFSTAFEIPDCTENTVERECNDVNNFLDLSVVSIVNEEKYKCYWEDSTAKSVCRACLRNMKCSDYTNNLWRSVDKVTCQDDPCNLGCEFRLGFNWDNLLWGCFDVKEYSETGEILRDLAR